MGTQIISVSISEEFYQLAKKLNISWSEAMRTGLSIMFADSGEMQYDNKLNLYRKMNFYRQQAEAASQEAAALTDKLLARDGLKREKKEEAKENAPGD